MSEMLPGWSARQLQLQEGATFPLAANSTSSHGLWPPLLQVDACMRVA